MNQYVIKNAETGEEVRDGFVLCPSDDAAIPALRVYAKSTDDHILAERIYSLIGRGELTPLSIGDLRAREGKPVWIKHNDKRFDGQWLIWSNAPLSRVHDGLEGYGLFWWAFDREPEEGEEISVLRAPQFIQ